MSKICCTFAPEIEKNMLNHLLPQAKRATLGSDPRGIRQQKTIAKLSARRGVCFFDFGQTSLLFVKKYAWNVLAIV